MRIHTLPLNIGDFLGDTVHMNATELGAYLSLIIAHIQSGEDGLPHHPKKLARMARVSDKVWRGQVGNTVMEKFHMHLHPTGNPAYTRLVSDICLETLQRIHHRSDQNRSNALKRHAPDNTIALRSQNKRRSIQNQNQI